MTPINIRVLRHSAFYTPLLLTIKAGYLQAEGLAARYDIASENNPVEAALAAGEVQVAQSAVATSFASLEKGVDTGLRHFAQVNERDGFFLIRRATGEGFNWEALPGKRLIADHFFQPLAMLKYALHQKGVDYTNIDILDAGGVNDMDTAFRAGIGDYVHQQGPYAQQLEADGIGQVVASVGEIIGPVAFSSLLASQAWLATDMALAFMRAYRQGQKAARSMPAHEIAHLEKDFFPDIDQGVLAKTVSSYQQLGCWSVDPVISQQAYACTLDVFEFSGMLSRRYNYHELICLPPDVEP